MKKWTVLIAFFAISSLVWAQNTTASNTVSESNSTKEEPSVIEQVEQWYSENMNYLTITALMTIESSFIPFPSEIVIPPAVYVAEDPNSSLHATDSNLVNMFLIVLFGTIGAMLGAIINYLLAMWLGRPIIYKFADSKIGHICLLSGEKVKKAEDYFNDHGKVSTFIGRLIPGIRQLVSIPAGLCKMHFGWFLFYTFLGASIWNIVLALLGYFTSGQKELIDTYSHEISNVIIALLGIAILYFVIKKIIKNKK